LQYRFNYLTRTLFSFIPLFAMLSLWRTIYAGSDSAGAHSGFTQAQMIFYYLLVAVVDVFTAVNEDDWQIAADIREGNISQFLLKPVDYLWYRLSLFCSGRLAFISMAALPLAVFIFCYRQYFLPPPGGLAFGLFLFSLVLTALLQFFISYAMAMLAFWLLEISTLIFILFAFEYLASGHLFPLDVLPPALKQILFLTPFPYQLYFPIQIYMGKVAGGELCRGLVMQFLWVLAAYGFARFMWRRGIKKYAAFGG
jgi:ABC-2 type transport system permease protein